ncbi:MAG: crossover junction endodeoxyribonuclease RuvC [Spirochaetales bacterium]|nr:crossover junction endodeoxyribonuclease RuvC [Spirochaetales bacterium]
MIILGIDPGLAKTGYGVIRIEGDRISHVTHDIISTGSNLHIGERLAIIFAAIDSAIKLHRPDYAAVENLYFAKNISSAFPVAQARGVVLLALAQGGVDTREYTPLEIKQAITGSGRAEKAQVQELVRFLLALQEIPKPDHAADALAAAICCYHLVSAEKKIDCKTGGNDD